MLIEIWRKNNYYCPILFLINVKTVFLKQIEFFKTIVNTKFQGINKIMK